MHYRNGREAHEGDPVIGKNYGTVVAGKLHSLLAGTDTCNGQVAYPVYGGVNSYCCTINELYHAEDAYNAIEATMAGFPAAPIPSGGWSNPAVEEQPIPGPHTISK